MFDKLFGRIKPPSAQIPEPFSLRRGAVVEIDSLPFRMLANQFAFELPAGRQPIEARGFVDLEAGVYLHRFYLSDDAWLQVKTTGGHSEAQADDIKLFTFQETKTPSNQRELEAIAGPNSGLGLPEYSFKGKTYRRVWGEGAGPAELVPFDETVYTSSDSTAEFICEHSAMLYERELAGSDRLEYLFVSVEQNGDDVAVVFSLGTDLSSADFTVI